MTTSILYKITTEELWSASQEKGRLALTAMDETFIHLAEADDVDRLIAKFFADMQSVIVLSLAPEKLEGRLVKERNPGGSKEYYHLYEGYIPLEAVVKWESRPVPQ